MNRRILLFLAAILSCGLLPFTSCTVNEDNAGSQPYAEGIEEKVDPTANVDVCNSATYIRGVGSMPLELQQAVYRLFPNVVSSLSEAEVAIVDASVLLVSLPEIYEFYDKGGQLVCFYPDLKNMLPEELGYTDLTGWDELLWGGNSRGDNFYMLNDPDEVVTTDENGEQKKQKLVKDLNYWILRLHPLVNWIDYSKQGTADTPALNRSDDGNKEPSLEKLIVDMRSNSAKHFECNFPFTLFHHITQATGSNPDSLKKAGSVSLRFEVMPIYAGELGTVRRLSLGDCKQDLRLLVQHDGLQVLPGRPRCKLSDCRRASLSPSATPRELDFSSRSKQLVQYGRGRLAVRRPSIYS